MGFADRVVLVLAAVVILVFVVAVSAVVIAVGMVVLSWVAYGAVSNVGM